MKKLTYLQDKIGFVSVDGELQVKPHLDILNIELHRMLRNLDELLNPSIYMQDSPFTNISEYIGKDAIGGLKKMYWFDRHICKTIADYEKSDRDYIADLCTLQIQLVRHYHENSSQYFNFC